MNFIIMMLNERSLFVTEMNHRILLLPQNQEKEVCDVTRPLFVGERQMGDRVSRPKQTIKPLQPVLKPVMAEQSSSEPAPSTVIVIMGASVSLLRPLHSRQGRNEDQTSYEQPWLRSEAYNAFPVFGANTQSC